VRRCARRSVFRAAEALKLKVIDLVADDVPNLLKRLEGRVLKAGDEQRVLHTAGRVSP